METLLAASIEAARRGGVVQKSSTQQVIVDTIVMPKAIAHSTDSRLLDKSRQHLVTRHTNMGSSAARTTTGWHRDWLHRSDATRTPSSSSA